MAEDLDLVFGRMAALRVARRRNTGADAADGIADDLALERVARLVAALLLAVDGRCRLELGRDLAPVAWIPGRGRHLHGLRVSAADGVVELTAVHAPPTSALAGRFLPGSLRGRDAVALRLPPGRPLAWTPAVVALALRVERMAAGLEACPCIACRTEPAAA